LTIC